MARKRIENRSTKKQWGVNRPVEIIRKRPDGTSYTEWRVAYRVLVNGLRIRRYACSSKSAEDAVLLAAQRASEGGYLPKAEVTPDLLQRRKDESRARAPRTIRAVADEMMEVSRRWRDRKFVELSPSYIRRVDNYVRHLQASGLGSKTLDELTALEIKRWFIAYATTHADSTTRNYRAWLLSVGDYAVDHDYWPKNLFRLITPVTMDSTRELRVLTLDEIDALWHAANTPQEQAALVLLRLGLRQGEVLALTDKAIIDDQTIQISYTLTERKNPRWVEGGKEPKNEQFLGRPKTARSRGRVHVPTPWMALLKEALALSKGSFVSAYDDLSPFPRAHKTIVCSPKGRLWLEWSASRAMRKLIERSGVEIGPNEATWHCWRHAYAADLIMMQADDLSLSRNLRHSEVGNLGKTVYGHARDEYRDLYAAYAQEIKSLKDFNEAICKFDTHRRGVD